MCCSAVGPRVAPESPSNLYGLITKLHLWSSRQFFGCEPLIVRHRNVTVTLPRSSCLSLEKLVEASQKASLAISPMLKREFKLKNSEEIKNVLKLGRKIRGSFLTLFLAPADTAHCRAAVVVSRKVAVTAVARNRVRRVIFSDLEKRFASWGNRPISAMVVMVMNIPEDENQLRAELEKCFVQV